jgi:hypothetical protein
MKTENPAGMTGGIFEAEAYYEAIASRIARWIGHLCRDESRFYIFDFGVAAVSGFFALAMRFRYPAVAPCLSRSPGLMPGGVSSMGTSFVALLLPQLCACSRLSRALSSRAADPD